jgi:peptidoglycan/LPS O-acetylase OafA/YrhL
MSRANSLEKSDFYLHRNNNFDSMRIIAAYAVIFAHSIPLSYGPQKLDILWGASEGQATFGYIAIQVFFIISGYLITGSYINTVSREIQKSVDYNDAQLKGMRRFLRARFLRLAPALLLVLFLIAFGLGPSITSVPLSTYFLSHLPYFTAMGLSDHLPGVFFAKSLFLWC